MPNTTPLTASGAVLDNVRALSERFSAERKERQQRRQLDRDDFEALADAGYLGIAVPASMGGAFQSFASSTRTTAETLRTLTHGDPAVALVAAMHPAVLAFWLAVEEAPDPGERVAWAAQRRFVFDRALEGHWWGTITSEPGSGGDVARTRSVALPTDDPARVPAQR